MAHFAQQTNKRFTHMKLLNNQTVNLITKILLVGCCYNPLIVNSACPQNFDANFRHAIVQGASVIDGLHWNVTTSNIKT